MYEDYFEINCRLWLYFNIFILYSHLLLSTASVV